MLSAGTHVNGTVVKHMLSTLSDAADNDTPSASTGHVLHCLSNLCPDGVNDEALYPSNILLGRFSMQFFSTLHGAVKPDHSLNYGCFSNWLGISPVRDPSRLENVGLFELLYTVESFKNLKRFIFTQIAARHPLERYNLNWLRVVDIRQSAI